MEKGFFIAFEGIDGTGKSTQLARLAQELRLAGHTVVETREPSDGPFGKRIRALYEDRGQCTIEEELELFLQDRKQHVAEVIIPALEAGKIVLTDRYYFSNAAYQGAAGCDPSAIFSANAFAPVPDLVILLTMKAELGRARIEQSRGESCNDFEQLEQLRKVAELFTSFSDDCIVRIDAAGSVERVGADIRQALPARLIA